MDAADNPADATARPSEREILARAAAMVPMLRERAAEAEALRRLPAATHRAFMAAGFYRIMQPRHYGGYELGFGTQVELGEELARGCGSSAWVATVTCCHAWIAGMFPPAAQDEVWGADPETLISSSFTPAGVTASREDGGWRVSGRWKFSSGVDLCAWSVVTLPAGGKPYFALLPLADCRIDDVWHVVGLAGTGSNDIVAENIFVPDHHLLPLDAMGGGKTPGSAVNDHYLYRMPVFAPFPLNLVGNVLGVARGVAEAVIAELTEGRARAGTPIAAHQAVQLRIAEAGAEIEAARALTYRVRDEVVRRAGAGEPWPLVERARYRRDVAYACRLCVQAVERLFPIVGGHGLMMAHPVQRGWRDLRGMTQHFGLSWDVQGSIWGSVILGQPSPDPRI